LGYIWADGTLEWGEHYKVSFRCWAEDRELIEKIKEEIGSKHKLADVPGKWIDLKNGNRSWVKPQVRLGVSGKEFVRPLIEIHGLEPAKSEKDLPFPSNVPSELLGHFCRGYIDGDGSWSGKQLVVLGTSLFLKGVRDSILFSGAKYKDVIPTTNLVTHRVGWEANEDLTKIQQWLYPEGSYLFMDRKKKECGYK